MGTGTQLHSKFSDSCHDLSLQKRKSPFFQNLVALMHRRGERIVAHFTVQAVEVCDQIRAEVCVLGLLAYRLDRDFPGARYRREFIYPGPCLSRQNLWPSIHDGDQMSDRDR
ncbi:hypothetical protein SADO_06297 [Salinisphaera dokdonensis CL-ES53]|uniref:Uncharacterized protein n=1 Tax=Salinisphaera dokdonensis CL-ES53 TaxID=1304272 RepID=A0ABV2AZZ7_9GAMM